MLASMLSRARAGQPLWLPDVRAAFLNLGGCDIIVRLYLWDGGAREWRHRLPRWDGAAERELVRAYLCAGVFNALSVCGGREAVFFFDTKDTALAALVGEMDGLFRDRAGLGRVFNIAARMGRAFGAEGEALRFITADISSYEPLPGAPARRAPELAKTLRGLCAEAETRNLIGIDIGGTDIKLAASAKGKLVAVREYDWNPAAFSTAEEFLTPILALLREARDSLGAAPDGVGVSFPDIVLHDRVVGGETPKTGGMRRNRSLDYEREFLKIGGLKDAILSLCAPGGRCRITNDGNAAAFTAAMEMACGTPESGAAVRSGVLAHTLGTDLGTGWLGANGTIPPLPLELYDLLIDLGSYPAAALPPEDLRSVRNESSGLPGARRYLGQAAAWRLAYELDPDMVRDFVALRDGMPVIRTEPEDLRKPCLARLMELAGAGKSAAEEVFRQIGRHLAQLSREAEFLLAPETPVRWLFGRFARSRRCFELLEEGFKETARHIRLERADETLANTPLMRQLADLPNAAPAQFGQAAGAVYFALTEE